MKSGALGEPNHHVEEGFCYAGRRMKRRSTGRGEKAIRKAQEATRYAKKKPVVFGTRLQMCYTLSY